MNIVEGANACQQCGSTVHASAASQTLDRCEHCGASLVLWSGSKTGRIGLQLPPVLEQRYELLRQLGAGAGGFVLEALDLSDGSLVAIKVLRTPDDKDWFIRFDREARILASIKHPNVVQLRGTGRFENYPYLVMDLVLGGNVRERIAAGPSAAPDALAIISGALGGLAACHARDVIHRDLKPENILLGADGVARVADFGIAKSIHGTCPITKTGMIIGSPLYMAPELLTGSPADAGTDLYAMAQILWELMTGRFLFESGGHNLPAILNAKENPELHLNAGQDAIPPAVLAAIRRAMSVRVEERFSDVASFARALEAQVQPASPRKERVVAPPPAPPPRARRGWKVGGAMLLVAVLLAFGAIRRQSAEEVKRGQEFTRLIEQARWSDALRLVEESLDQSSDRCRSLLAKVDCLRQLRRYSEVPATARLILDAHPDPELRAQTLWYLADSYRERSQLDSAEAAAREAIAASPDSSHGYDALMRVLLLRPDRRREIPALLQAFLEKNPDNDLATTYVATALRALSKEQHPQAEALLRGALARNAGSFSTRYLLVQWLVEEGRTQEARQELKILRVHASVAQLCDVDSWLAKVEVREGNLAAAEQILWTQVGGRTPNEGMIGFLAGVLLNQKKLSDAERLMRAAIARAPAWSSHYAVLAAILLELKNPGEARALLATARRLGYDDPERLNFLSATALALEGDADGARKICDQILKKNPGAVDARQLLLGQLRKTNHVDLIVQTLRGGIAAGNGPSGWHAQLIDALEQANRFPEALSAVEQAPAEWREAVAGRMCRARFLAKLGRPFEAQTAIMQILDTDPRNAEAKRLLKAILQNELSSQKN